MWKTINADKEYLLNVYIFYYRVWDDIYRDCLSVCPRAYAVGGSEANR